MTLTEQKKLFICQNIEFGLKQEYERNSELSDTVSARALDNAKIACKHQFGFAQNESVSTSIETEGIVGLCVAIALKQVKELETLTLKEYMACIEKVRRSVLLHSQDGKRGYYKFVRRFLS